MGNDANHFFGALGVDGSISVEKFKKPMDEMIGAFEALPTLPGVERIYVAGGHEARIEQDRRNNGTSLPAIVIQGEGGEATKGSIRKIARLKYVQNEVTLRKLQSTETSTERLFFGG